MTMYTSSDGAIVCESINLVDFCPGDERVLWLWVNPSIEYILNVLSSLTMIEEVNAANASQAQQALWSFTDLFNKGPEDSHLDQDQVINLLQDVRDRDPEMFKWINCQVGRKLALFKMGMTEEGMRTIERWQRK
jgi:hypothetical protein